VLYHALLDPEAADRRMQVALQELVDRFGVKAGTPVSYLEQNWSQEPYQAGCVPRPRPGVLTKAHDGFAKPIGRLHFAGAESSHIWEGYMDRAVRAGIELGV
jgi:monoamine oxidase